MFEEKEIWAILQSIRYLVDNSDLKDWKFKEKRLDYRSMLKKIRKNFVDDDEIVSEVQILLSYFPEEDYEQYD